MTNELKSVILNGELRDVMNVHNCAGNKVRISFGESCIILDGQKYHELLTTGVTSTVFGELRVVTETRDGLKNIIAQGVDTKTYYISGRSAKVYENSRCALLKSYSSDVAFVDKLDGRLYVSSYFDYSNTTARHMNKFLSRFCRLYFGVKDIREAIKAGDVQVVNAGTAYSWGYGTMDLSYEFCK